MRISGVIFDMDGTLLDSMHIWEGLAQEHLRSRGIEPRADLDARIFGLSLPAVAAYLVGEYHLPETPEELLSGIERAVRARYDRVAPKPGVLSMLDTLRARGVRMALATLTEREDALRVLSRVGILPYLSHIVTCSEVGVGKSSPAVYRAALAALGTKKEETPVFEDAYHALLTAHNDGFPTVAVYDKTAECRFAEASALSFLSITDYRTVDLAPYLP